MRYCVGRVQPAVVIQGRAVYTSVQADDGVVQVLLDEDEEGAHQEDGGGVAPMKPKHQAINMYIGSF